MLGFLSGFSPTAEVRKILLPQTTGEDQPQPGMSVFQTTFSVSLHVSGSVLPSPSPSDCAPRNCGQLIVSAEKADMTVNTINDVPANNLMISVGIVQSAIRFSRIDMQVDQLTEAYDARVVSLVHHVLKAEFVSESSGSVASSFAAPSNEGIRANPTTGARTSVCRGVATQKSSVCR